MNDNFIKEAHDSATEWARALLARDPSTWVILDTETTGLRYNDEVIQIGMIDGAGNVLIENQLVKPTCPISIEARQVHGIFPVHVENAPSFADVLPHLRAAVAGKLLVIYNAEFDLRMLEQSARAHGQDLGLKMEMHTCAMKTYALWYGDWNDYHQSFRWQRLPGGDHSALGDCRSALELIRKMAEDA